MERDLSALVMSCFLVDLDGSPDCSGSSSMIEVGDRFFDRTEAANGWSLSGKKFFGASSRNGKVRTNWRKK